MKIAAILFDMDGVLVDNHAYHVKAWQQFAQKHNLHLSEEEFDKHINGRTIEAALDYFFGSDKTEAEKKQLAEEKEQLYRDLYGPNLAAVAGLTNVLERLKQEGRQMAVVSSAMLSNIDMVLDGLNIRSYFDAIVHGSQVSKSKPEPDIYLYAAQQLSCEPRHCLVLEDSKSGIEAGWNAGMEVVALATTHSQEELRKFGVKHIIADFRAFTLEEIENNA